MNGYTLDWISRSDSISLKIMVGTSSKQDFIIEIRIQLPYRLKTINALKNTSEFWVLKAFINDPLHLKPKICAC